MNPITALLQLLSGCTDCEEIKSLCSLFLTEHIMARAYISIWQMMYPES